MRSLFFLLSSHFQYSRWNAPNRYLFCLQLSSPFVPTLRHGATSAPSRCPRCVCNIIPVTSQSQVKTVSSSRITCSTHMICKHWMNMCRINKCWPRSGDIIFLPATTHCLQFLLFAHHLRHCEFVFAFNDSLGLALSLSFSYVRLVYIVIGSRIERRKKKTEVKQIKGTRAYIMTYCAFRVSSDVIHT